MTSECGVEKLDLRTVAVIGAGGWGTALARLVARSGHHVRIWAHESATVEDINQSHENRSFLPGVILPAAVQATLSLEEVLTGADAAIFAVPSIHTRRMAGRLAPLWQPGRLALNAGKGLESGSGLTMSQVYLDCIPQLDPGCLAVLSGPNHSEEVGRDVPSASVVASTSQETAGFWQDLLTNDFFRIYTNPDVRGVELGGALKNVVALAAGMCDGLEFGDNTKAAVMTRGIAEMARLGSAMGADPLTFAGLSGVGDLIATASSRHSRNRWAGEEMGRGRSSGEILDSTRMAVEGIHTTKAAVELAHRWQVEIPLTEAVWQIIRGTCSPEEAVRNLMQRDPTQELEQRFNRP